MYYLPESGSFIAFGQRLRDTGEFLFVFEKKKKGLWIDLWFGWWSEVDLSLTYYSLPVDACILEYNSICDCINDSYLMGKFVL